MSKARDAKESILVREIWGKMRAREGRRRRGEGETSYMLDHTHTRIFLGHSRISCRTCADVSCASANQSVLSFRHLPISSF